MEKLKLKSGRELDLKDISLDERDELVDSLAECENVYNSKGDVIGIKSMMKTVTKWLRICLNGQGTDEFIIGLTMDERTEFFLSMKEKLIMGEENASKLN
tara:strand:+ start:1614 stop:1913 length:300 start_codon:yes stop_codon:yes gene_type:complete